METKLKEHNVEPVKKVLDAFNAGEQRVALAHATGTGKSYATCAIIELGNFKKVLYLSPSNHINKYFERVVIKNLESRQAINILATYSFLLHRDLKSLAGKYDLIVLDEYHRLGARTWGKTVKDLLELNPQAKILGLTATEVRYLDNWRNMSKELNFKVISTITLVDAIERRILPAPEYIIGFSDFDIIIKELEDLAIKYKADKEYLEEIKKMKVDWINSNGLAGIVRYHLPITTSKIVVFSEAIERYDKIVEKMTEILTAAGFKNLKFLRADSSNTKEAIKNIEYFSNNNDKNEVKVVISVNMLNEGIHAEGAEACFMFRKTKSATIFLQQLGRVESSLSPEKRPIVFDLVDNISNDWELFTEIGLRQVGIATKVKYDCIRRIFGKAGIRVYSYVEAYVDMKEKLNRLYGYHWHTIQELIDFVNIHKRLPKSNIKEEKQLYIWMRIQVSRGNKEIIDIYKKYKKMFYAHHTVQELIDFVNMYNRLPRKSVKEEKPLKEWMYRQIKLGNKEVIEIYEKYKICLTYSIQDLVDFVNTYNRLPNQNHGTKKEKGICSWMYRQIKLGNKEVIEIYEKYKICLMYSIQDLVDFVNTYNRLPKSNKENRFENQLYNWMRRQLHKGNQEVIDIYNRFNPDKPWKG